MESLEGHLLVASPHLADPNFARTVVLMIQHNDEGAVGVVLNRPSEHSLRDIWEKVSDKPCTLACRLRLGGPVGGQLMAIHTNRDVSEKEIVTGVFFSTNKDALEAIVDGADEPFYILTGYAGWAGGQLEEELKTGSWLTVPATYEYVFYGDEDIWKQVARDIGNEILLSSVKIKHVPEDPSVN
ncbi:MAG: YqgE/AlgH family protein [Pirellulales bacterium]